MLPEGACTCAITRDGKRAGCASLEVVDTEYGPRYREKPCGTPDAGHADGGDPLTRAWSRFDAEQEAAARGGAPAGALTRENVGAAVKVNGGFVRGRRVPVEDAAFDPTTGGPPPGALVRGDREVFNENGTLIARRVQIVPDE